MGPLSITSPNIRFIPFMPTGPVSLRMREDGRFAEHDFTLCPQALSDNHVHRILVRDRKSAHNDHIDCMWWTPEICDFDPLPHSAYSDLGRCVNGRILRIDELCSLLKTKMMTMSTGCDRPTAVVLNNLASSMRRASLALRFHSYTLREMMIGVAYTQRSYLDALAYSDYIEYRFGDKMNGSTTASVQVPMLHVLGASSTDAATVNRLQLAGVPAYLVVPDEDALVLGATVVEAMPSSPFPFSVNPMIDEGREIQPMPLLHNSSSPSEMHAVMTMSPHYASLERYFIGLDANFTVVPLGVRGIVCVNEPVAPPKRKGRATTRKGAKRSQLIDFYILTLHKTVHLMTQPHSRVTNGLRFLAIIRRSLFLDGRAPLSAWTGDRG